MAKKTDVYTVDCVPKYGLALGFGSRVVTRVRNMVAAVTSIGGDGELLRKSPLLLKGWLIAVRRHLYFYAKIKFFCCMKMDHLIDSVDLTAFHLWICKGLGCDSGVLATGLSYKKNNTENSVHLENMLKPRTWSAELAQVSWASLQGPVMDPMVDHVGCYSTQLLTGIFWWVPGKTDLTGLIRTSVGDLLFIRGVLRWFVEIVECLQIRAGAKTTLLAGDGHVIKENVPITNLRISSRKATLSDCTCFLRPGLDVCVLSTCQLTGSSSKEENQEPVTEECEERRIRVTNTLDVLTDDVANVAIGLALATLRKICWVLTKVRNTLAAVISIRGDRELLRETRRPHPPAHRDDRLQDCVNCVIVDPRRKQKILMVVGAQAIVSRITSYAIRLPLLDYVIDDLFQTCFSSLLWILFFRNRIHPTGIVVFDFQQRVCYSLVDLITTIRMRRLVTFHHLHQ
ncbi:hypothetical protein RHSIM_Rhsim03G0253900 [Rhododendron simsii]|uniref:Uncharacterized protein n=1 Tax=Rhododendron simsii TaxID=118357 RepID=A0A834H666_RHOSS|nr:hypothetical protein RHSIM_Rhsim03G0253900 [Rhododendron simsii]